MSKASNFSNDLLKLIFNNVDISNIGDATGLRGSTLEGDLYIALYKTDPTDADVGTEANYTNYARVAGGRSVVVWTVSGSSCTNAGSIIFPVSTGVVNTITHFGIRTAVSGGDLLYHGSLTGSVNINLGETPKFNGGNLTITES